MMFDRVLWTAFCQQPTLFEKMASKDGDAGGKAFLWKAEGLEAVCASPVKPPLTNELVTAVLQPVKLFLSVYRNDSI